MSSRPEYEKREGSLRAPKLPAALDELMELFARRVAEWQLQLSPAADATEERSPWMGIERTSAYLDCPQQRLYKLTARGEIPHYKQEGRLLFRRDELDEWLRGFAQPQRKPSG